MKLAKLFAALVLSAGALSAADAAITGFLPPGTKIVLGVRVRSLADSPFAKGIMAQAHAAGAEWLNMAAALGFDPLRDLDEVLIATSGEGQNPPSLLVASGRFDVPRLSEGAQRYHDVPILGGAKPTDQVVAILDANTALAGDRPMVLAAIDRGGAASEATPDNSLAARIAPLRERYDVWGAGDHIQAFGPVPQASVADAFDSFQFGMSVRQGLELAAEVHASSPKGAEKLSASLGLLSAMLRAQQPAGGAKFDLQADNGTFKLAVTIPEEELKKAMEAQSGMLAQMLGGGTMAPATRLAPGPAPRTTPPPVLDKDGNTVVLTLPGGKH